jgi:hypothetical protein
MTQTKKDKIVLNKIHYVCMSCRSSTNDRGKCTTPGCPRARNPLSECQCKDGKHKEVPKLNAAGYAE